jgi:hypothetical protein
VRLEHRLLVALSRRAGFDELPPAMLAPLARKDFRESFLSLARQHRVHGVVLANLERASLAGSLPEVASEICERLRHLRWQAAPWDLERDRVLTLLDRRGLEPVLLKGAALRDTIYSEPAERPIGDLDLLVPREQVDGAVRSLIDAGYGALSEEVSRAYREHHFHVRLNHRRGFRVEIHWALTAPRSPFHLDAGAFLRRAVTRAGVRCATLRVPSPEDMLLHLASQNVEDAFSRLCRVVDLDRIVGAEPDLDWDYTLQSARTGGLEIVLATALDLARTVLGTAAPADVVSRLRLPRSTRLHLALFRPASALLTRHARVVAPAHPYLLLWSMPKWRDRKEFLLRMLAGNEDPLHWLWAGHRSPEVPPPRRLAGGAKVAKLLGYHAWLYLRAGAALVTATGRAGDRLWSGNDDVSPSPMHDHA